MDSLLKTVKRHWIITLLLLAALGLAACEEPEEEEVTEGEAEVVLAEGKTELETLLGSDDNSAESILATAGKFNTAYQLDPSNQEAAFFAGLSSTMVFLGSQDTTDFLGNMGLMSFQDEMDQCHPFNVDEVDCPYRPFDAGDLIVGGNKTMQTFVDLSLTEINDYLLAGMPDAMDAGFDILSGISSDFNITLNNTRESSTWEIDYTDVQVLKAAHLAMQVPTRLSRIWNFQHSSLDDYISTDPRLTRDGITGEFTGTQENVELAFEDTFRKGFDGTNDNGDEILMASTAGATEVKNLLYDAFGTLEAALGSMLAETDDQQNDLFSPSHDYADFDAQPDLDLFQMDLIRRSAATMKTAFDAATTGATTVNFYEMVVSITDFGECTPIAGQPTESYINNWGGAYYGDISSIANAEVVDLPLNQATGTAPGALFPDFSNNIYRITLTQPENLSIFFRDTGPDEVDTHFWLLYRNEFDELIGWDEDYGSGENQHAGVSIDADYFGQNGLPVPSAQTPLELYVFVHTHPGNQTAFGGFAWTDTGAPDTIPIFLRGGGGRNFTVSVYAEQINMDPRQAVNIMSNIFDNTNRTTLTKDDSATEFVDESKLLLDAAILPVTEVRKVFPGIGVTLWENDGDPTSFNLFQDSLEVSDPGSYVKVTSITIPAAVQSFCAYPWRFDSTNGIEGGFRY
ncbi:MAG: hypothetical protein OEZ59_13755 [Deltaproteobacteria bacterium]|nr:hypothetical protein [Deltaproteobacteria bacterium]